MYNPSYNPSRSQTPQSATPQNPGLSGFANGDPGASGAPGSTASSPWWTQGRTGGNAYAQSQGLDYGGNNEVGTMLRNASFGLYPGMMQNLQFGEGLNGQRQGAISALLASLSQSGQNAQMHGLQNQAITGAAQGAQQGNAMNRQMGLGDGFQAGSNAAAMQGGQRQASGIAQDYASPQHQQAAMQAILSAISQGQQNPELQQQMQLFGPIEQRSQANIQQHNQGNFFNQIAPILGAMSGSGGGFGSIFGGGGGNSSSPFLNGNNFLSNSDADILGRIFG